MDTQEDVRALAARVAAEPDPDRRADLLAIDLPRIAKARTRFQVLGWIVAALLAAAVVAAPVSQYLALEPAFRDFFVQRLRTHGAQGLVVVFCVFFLAPFFSALVRIPLRGGGPRMFLLRTIVGIAMTPGLLTIVGLILTKDPFAQIGLIAGTPLAAAVVSTKIADVSRRVRDNHPDIVRQTVDARALPAIQTLHGYRVRWMVMQVATDLLHWTATTLLVITVPWSLPFVVIGRVFLLVIQTAVQRQGSYRVSIAIGAVYVIAFTAIALLLGGALLFPSGLVEYGVVPA